MKTRKRLPSQVDSGMKRILTVLDLTLLCMGSMLGMGAYVMTGAIAKSVGPAMVLSYALAGIACILSAFCYAEFAVRAPGGTGSAYENCYSNIGEFVAFLLGWNLVLEFVIGTACLARGLSGYIDSLLEYRISNSLHSLLPINSESLSNYPDFLSMLIMIVFSGIVSSGVRASSYLNNIVVVINLITITLILVVGIYYANKSNWTIDPKDVPPNVNAGKGGFMPFGINAMMEGTATCFFAYTGFDTVATTGAEAMNPRKAIIIALIFSLLSVLVIYIAITTTFSLMCPYYDADPAAPFPDILGKLGEYEYKWIITCGAVAAIVGSTLASIYGMARTVQLIAYDGLLFSFLSNINKKTKTPVNACMFCGVVTGLLSIIFDTDELINMTSLGTLMAYTMIAIYILVLRYEPNLYNPETQQAQPQQQQQNEQENLSTISARPEIEPRHSPPPPAHVLQNMQRITSSLLNLRREKTATWISFEIALCCITAYSLSTFGLNVILTIFGTQLAAGELGAVIPASIFAVIMLCLFVILQRQPKGSSKLIIQVKPVPLFPLLTIFADSHLMLRLEWTTWLRVIIWLSTGVLIYFWYGINHSKERQPKSE